MRLLVAHHDQIKAWLKEGLTVATFDAPNTLQCDSAASTAFRRSVIPAHVFFDARAGTPKWRTTPRDAPPTRDTATTAASVPTFRIFPRRAYASSKIRTLRPLVRIGVAGDRSAVGRDRPTARWRVLTKRFDVERRPHA